MESPTVLSSIVPPVKVSVPEALKIYELSPPLPEMAQSLKFAALFELELSTCLFSLKDAPFIVTLYLLARFIHVLFPVKVPPVTVSSFADMERAAEEPEPPPVTVVPVKSSTTVVLVPPLTIWRCRIRRQR